MDSPKDFPDDVPDQRPDQRLALIECLERDGRIARTFDVWQWPLRIGRAIDNHLVLDDPFVAAHHACLQATADGALQLQVLHTCNGVLVDAQRHGSGALVTLPAAGTTLQLGAGKLRLRLPGETLAAEQPLPRLVAGARLRPWLAGGLMLLLVLAEQGLALDPGADVAAWLPVAVGLPAALACWCGLWALMSKLFQHRFDFTGHLRIVLPWLLVIMLLQSTLPQLGASLGWPWLWRLAAPLQALLGALMLRAHLVHVLPQHERAVSAAVAAALLAGGAIQLSVTHRATDSFSRAPYMSTLPLPAMHWARTVDAEVLVQELEPLAQAVAQRVQQAQLDETEKGSDDAGD